MQKIAKNLPSAHHRTTLSGYIFATKTHRQSEKKLVKQQYLPHMSLQYGELGSLAAEIVPLVWGTPANFNGFRILAALMHGTLVVGVSQTLRHWTEGATYIQQGGNHVGYWLTFLVYHCVLSDFGDCGTSCDGDGYLTDQHTLTDSSSRLVLFYVQAVKYMLPSDPAVTSEAC